jgi:hypothetical protein
MVGAELQLSLHPAAIPRWSYQSDCSGERTVVSQGRRSLSMSGKARRRLMRHSNAFDLVGLVQGRLEFVIRIGLQ